MRFLPLVLLALLAALPARAEPTAVLTALEQTPADPAWWGKSRFIDVVDLAALKQVSGVGEAVRFADFANKTLPDEEMERVTSLAWRLHGGVGFREYLLAGGEAWPEIVGVDFLQLDWFSEPGTPPRVLLLLGGAALPQGQALEVLANVGLAPVEHGGTTVWTKGEKDYGVDVQHRNVRVPFWGWLGSSVRVFRGEHALVGARSWADIELALAVERGEAESLADLPSFRLAAEAAAQAAFSAGPILQMTFVDQTVGEGALAPAPDGLPPFELLAFADREDARGHQVVLVLTYGSDAETAAAVSDRLPAAVAAYRDQGGGSLAERFPGLEVTATPLETEQGAAAVLRLATPPEPLKTENGKVNNRSRLYAQILRMLYSRDLGFLAPRG